MYSWPGTRSRRTSHQARSWAWRPEHCCKSRERMVLSVILLIVALVSESKVSKIGGICIMRSWSWQYRSGVSTSVGHEKCSPVKKDVLRLRNDSNIWTALIFYLAVLVADLHRLFVVADRARGRRDWTIYLDQVTVEFSNRLERGLPILDPSLMKPRITINFIRVGR